MNETVLTVVGNVASDPTLRATSSGVKVASFRLASTERRYDKGLNSWRDGETLFWSVSCWRALGENVAESLEKGQPVIVHGRLRERVYEVEGQRRTSLDIDAVIVGHDLARGVARFRKASGVERELAPADDLADDDRSGASGTGSPASVVGDSTAA